jgi:hypothetical protein
MGNLRNSKRIAPKGDPPAFLDNSRLAGGARVVYLHIPEVSRIDLLAIYGKNEKDDLSAEDRKALAALARQAKAEAIAGVRKGGRRA